MRQVLNQNGLTLVEILVATAITGIITFSAITLTQQVKTVDLQIGAVQTANMLRQSVMETLSSSHAWDKTLQANPAVFVCLINNTTCRGAGGPFQLLDAEGQTIVSLDNNAGFELSGAACTSFNNSGSRDCPFKMRTSWTAVCPPTGDCRNPQIQIQGQLTFRPSGFIEDVLPFLNTQKYSFSYVRGPTLNTLEGNCAALGGSWDPVARTCTLPIEGECPPGPSMVLGINRADNTKIFGFPINHRCGPNENAMEIQGDGTFRCQPMICTPCEINGKPRGALDPYAATGDGADGSCDGNDGTDGSDGCDGTM